MNTTFTNYAEKKAKQFLNLLQGYTKGIRMTVILILLLMGVNNAWAAYYYRGNQNSWGASKMTASADGFYEYFAAKSHANNGNQNQMFKVSTSSSSWDYNNGYMKSGFNGTNITNMGNWDSDNICMYHDKDYYILVYKPNTTVNNTTKPIVCAATYLPDNRECTVYFVNKDSWSSVNAYGWYYQKSTDGPNNGWPGKAMENTGKTYNGKQIWSYTYPQTYDKAIFNNGSSKTSDLTLGTTNKGKMYDYPNSQWIDYNYDVKVTFNANGHGTAPTAKTVLKGGKVSAPTAPTATGYTFDGWYKESGCTNAFDFNTAIDADITLYAKWTENTYTVTITNDGHGTTNPSGEQSNVGEVTGLSIKATPAANYEFVNWTITSGSGSFGSATSASTTFKPTSAATIQANFRSTATNSLTVVAGANIASVTGSTNPVTLGSPYAITATPKTGYTFSTWTADPAENAAFGSATTANTTVTVNNGSVTVTASATENMSTLTTSNNYDAGDPSYEVPTASVNSIGYETTATVTATAAGNGYTFTGWTLTNCTRTDGGAAEATSITVRSNGDGEAATVVANYAEDCNTTWVLAHSIDGFNTSSHPFVKKSGESTGKVAYVSLDLAANTAYTFKVKNGDKWYGNNNSNEQHWIKATAENWEFWDDAGDCHMRSSVAGTYTFKIDFSGTNPLRVSVYFPTAYKITYGVGTNEGTDKVTTEPSVTSGSLVIPSSSITFSKGETKEGYTWKNWNSKADGSGTNLGTGDTYVSSNRVEDITVYACYDLIEYTITYNTNGGDGAMNPPSYKVTTETFSLPSPTKTGYTFAGWYNNAELIGDKITQIAEGSTGDKTFYAKWDPAKYTITYKDQGGEEFSGTHENEHPTTHTYNTPTTLKGATRVGYDFGGWFATIDCSSEPVITLGSTEYTTDITLYAKWLPKTYTINLDPQEGSGGTSSVSVTSGGPLSTIDVPSREAYNFGGYYDQEGGQGTQYYQPDGTSAKNWDKGTDATLYAHWIPTEYDITYELNGGTNHASNPATYNITDEVILQTPTYKGYTFLGWYESVDFAGEVISSIPKGSTGSKTFYAKWEIGTYTITLDLQGGTGGTETVSAIYGSAMPTITVPTREGYLFDGYYDQTGGKGTKYYNADGTNVKNWDKENATLYAKWISHSDCIFFKNNLKWANVYIYTFTDNAWYSNVNDPGVHPKTNKKEHGKMTQVGQSDIYYYVLTKGNNFNYIAFSNVNMSNNDAFYTNAGIYRGDHDVDMTLFIPEAKQRAETHNQTKYYNKGVWMKYNSAQSGYQLNIVSGAQVEFTTDKVGGYVFTATMELSGKQNMDITNLQDERKYANNGTMTQKNCTNWQMSEWTWADESKWYVQTTSAGDYVFTLDLSDGQVRVSVQYPLAVGDYRLAYQENDGAKNTKFHPAQYIRKVTEDTKLDIVSFFVNKAGQSPSIVLQKCDAVSNTGVGTWSTIETKPIDLSKIEQSGVYNVALQQTNEGSHQATILCNDETYPQPYTGNYYIRTDAANGGWGFYEQETNQMEYTNLNADYDYYYCKWFNNPTGNVRFVVANDYSECVSDTMTRDDFLEGEKLLGESANVRFAWSSTTNTTSRAYLAGSGSDDEYLTISGTNIYTNAEVEISGKCEFVDQNDWVYALDIKAKHGAEIDVIAKYQDKESTFIDNQNIMSTQENDDKFYTLRVIYNFKTNNIVSSWLLQNVEQNMALSADIMMIRNGQNAPNQLTLNGHKITGDPKTVYGVMQFDKSDITDNTKSIEERGLYWISFPFDVNLVDVFGLGEYGTAWIIQYYDGAERAQKGWFQETATFWKYVMPEDRKNFVLKANVGYGLALDIEAIEWPNDIEQQNLYFPSAEKIDIIGSELTSTTVKVPAHTCTIERDDRKTKDSHWNVIGVPSYADAEDVLLPDGLNFLYEWNATNNTLSVSEATTHTFKAMHSYMVQFAGTIDWEHKKIAPAALAAKAPAKESTLLQLTLTEGDKQLDQTYVELTDEATAAFDMNMDLTKFFNTGHANIYSCIQTVPVAANMLPVQSVQVPLGIQVVKEGSYTIALPASVDAALVTLIDNQTQTHTCLNTSDYTVTLPAGTYENRFFLAVEPQRVVTSNPANKQDTAPTVKFIKDGQLYILHQGVIYDAQGRR